MSKGKMRKVPADFKAKWVWQPRERWRRSQGRERGVHAVHGAVEKGRSRTRPRPCLQASAVLNR